MRGHELGELLGTSPEAVCRGLAEFRKKGWISLEGRRLRILDEKRLRAVARVASWDPIDFYQARTCLSSSTPGGSRK